MISSGLGASIARFAAFFQRDPVGDPTWVSVELMMWTIIEVSVYLIAACLPTLRPLVVLVWDKESKIFSSKGDRSKGSNQNSSLAGKAGQISKTITFSVRGAGQSSNEEYHELVEQNQIGFQGSRSKPSMR